MISKYIFSRLNGPKNPAIILNNNQLNALASFKSKLNKGIYSLEEVDCLCGSQETISISSYDRYLIPVNTKLCKNCGIMLTSPRMNKDSLYKFYEEDYRLIYTGSEISNSEFFNNQIKHGEIIKEFIENNIIIQSDYKIFDIGCGSGGMLYPFKESGIQTYGCDIGSKYLEHGINLGLNLEHGDERSLVKYGKANLIILSHILEHYSDPLKSLRKLSNLLVDDGYIYVELPGIFNIHKTYFGDILRFLQNAHLYHFTLSTLSWLMSKAGFKLINGNETIQALYLKQYPYPRLNTSKLAYRKIILYLYIVEIHRILRTTNTARWLSNTIKSIKYRQV